MERIRWCGASAAFALVIWQFLSLAVHDSRLFPGIEHVTLHSLPSIAAFAGDSKENYATALKVIVTHSGYTFLRLICGLLFGTFLGVAIGMGIHFFRRYHNANVLALTVVRSIPLFALIPLFLYWFGGKEAGIYIYITFAISVIIATSTYEAVCNVPSDYANQAYLLGANRLQVFRTVYAYAIGPEMIGSLRNVLGLSWAFSLGAEYLSANSGLGYLVYQSYLYSDMGKLLVFVLLYGIYGVCGYLLADRLLCGLRRWHVAAIEEVIA
jgi:ABC-type nitrate/sulfonate/bicarbonate transport system permease component